MKQQAIDPKQIKQITGRFVQLSNIRLERMLASFNQTQADSIQLLPLLFHLNNPLLPGYVDKSTPSGIPNYTPSSLEKKIAKTISRTFEFKSRAYLKYEIVGLYLMGSTGTLAQSIRSDLDLWVCVDELPDKATRLNLEKKTQLISAWMATRGVELNCYIVHREDFSQQKSKHLTKESCGDTQNYLLLDEFYRTAIWLCGRKPLWWVVPLSENYPLYAERLLGDKHLDWADWIDFGNIPEIPPTEYFSASLWQLYKSIESPYKSSLKLLILEIYARHIEETGLLSDQYKHAVYNDSEDDIALDPYVLMLNYATAFLQDKPQRLEFLRRAFYLKSGTKIQLDKSRPNSWRYTKLKKLVIEWGWNQQRLDYLNQRSGWRMNRVLKERQELVRELNHSYHFLASFARVNGVEDKVSQDELLALGRKLYAVLEKRAGKIELVNTGIANNLSEGALTLEQTKDGTWLLYLGLVSQKQLPIHQPIYRADSMFKLISWCICNRIINRETAFQVYANTEYQNAKLARSIASQLAKLISMEEIFVSDKAFSRPAMELKVGLFFNTKKDPLVKEKARGVYSVSGNSDVFSWGDGSINLLSQFEAITVNSWGESICKEYKGESGWVLFFVENRAVIAESEQRLSFHYLGGPTLPGQEERILSLLDEWNRLFLKHLKVQKDYRFMMSMAEGFLRLDFTSNEVNFGYYPGKKPLLESLIQAAAPEIEDILDDKIKLDAVSKKVIGKATDGKVNCYLAKVKANTFAVYLKSAAGNIYYAEHANCKLASLTNFYQQFLDSIDRSGGFLEQRLADCQFWICDPTDTSTSNRFSRLKPKQMTLVDGFLGIQAVAQKNSEGWVCYDLFCEDSGFRYRDYGELVFRKLAQMIRQTRIEHEKYPVFITDVDLSAVFTEADFCQYFQAKREIEAKLLKALQQLSSA